MIGIKVWEHLTLVPILRKIFVELLEYFSETRSALFHPQPKCTPCRSGVWRSTRFCLRACTTWRFLLAWGFSAGNELQIIFFVTSNRENLLILDNVSKINVSSNILSSTFQNSFFRVKLQTSLYHPIPLDSKPYKQTNRLENLLLFEACNYFSVFFLCTPCISFSSFLYLDFYLIFFSLKRISTLV